MRAHLWGWVNGALVRVQAERIGFEEGLVIVGVPRTRERMIRDRIQSAILNGTGERTAPVRLRVSPAISGGCITDLDLPLALVALGAAGIAAKFQVMRTLALGGLRLDGSLVVAAEPVGAPLKGIEHLIIPANTPLSPAVEYIQKITFARSLSETLRR